VAASSTVTCRYDCGLLPRQAISRGADRAAAVTAAFGMPVVACRRAEPAHQPPGAGRLPRGWQGGGSAGA